MHKFVTPCISEMQGVLHFKMQRKSRRCLVSKCKFSFTGWSLFVGLFCKSPFDMFGGLGVSHFEMQRKRRRYLMSKCKLSFRGLFLWVSICRSLL